MSKLEDTETQEGVAKVVHHREADFEFALKQTKKLPYDPGIEHPAMGESEPPVSGGVQEEVGTAKWAYTLETKIPTLIRGASISWGQVAHYKWK